MFVLDDRAGERARAGREAAAGGRGRATWLLDGLTDVTLVAFAVWTVVYHVGLVVRPPTWMLLVGWFVALAVLSALYARWLAPGLRRPDAGAPAAPPPRVDWPLPVLAVVSGVVAGAAAGLHDSNLPWWPAWAFGLLSVSATVAAFLRSGHASGAGELPASTGRGGTLIPVVTAAGFAVASLFIVNTDADDSYFVSRSVWTAAHGRIPFRDVIFTQGTAPPVSGEPPVSSVEVLVGALARPLGVSAPSLLWYAVLPFVVFLAVWALWRLVREWAPRRLLACFAIAAAYLLWAGLSPASLGAFHLLRMWQGKAMFVSALIPLLYVYLSRWAERRSPVALCLAVAAGVAATGLTSSAAFVVPLVAAAAAGPLLVTGRVRAGLAVAAVPAYPLVAGALVALSGSPTEVSGTFTDAPVSFSWVFMSGFIGVLAGCAIWCGPWLARRGAPALMAAGVAAVAAVLFVDGVLEFVGTATHAGQVMWRTMWVVPAPVLIGLLAATPVRKALGALPGGSALPSSAVALVAAVPAMLVGAVLLVAGVPSWTHAAGSVVQDRPSWKADPQELSTARAVVRAARGTGTVLMPQLYMRAVPQFSARVNAVNPNTHYLRNLPVSRSFIDDRLLLTGLVRSPQGSKPGAEQVRGALSRVRVSVACARPDDRAAVSVITAAGYGDDRRLGELTCLFPAERDGTRATG